MNHAEATESYAQHFNFGLRVREEEWDEDVIADMDAQTVRARKEMHDIWKLEGANR